MAATHQVLLISLYSENSSLGGGLIIHPLTHQFPNKRTLLESLLTSTLTTSDLQAPTSYVMPFRLLLSCFSKPKSSQELVFQTLAYKSILQLTRFTLPPPTSIFRLSLAKLTSLASAFFSQPSKPSFKTAALGCQT